jgi:hypothetical protein
MKKNAMTGMTKSIRHNLRDCNRGEASLLPNNNRDQHAGSARGRARPLTLRPNCCLRHRSVPTDTLNCCELFSRGPRAASFIGPQPSSAQLYVHCGVRL